MMRSASKPPTGPPVEIGQVIADRYRIDGAVGEGGMGVVVSATHLVLQQRVAIKFLRREAMGDADAVRRFVTEARAAAKVKSSHVVNVHDVATLEDGTPYIVMEFIEGNALSMLLETRGALPVNEAVRYMVQACEALAETHAAGIVHGDLKPDNIYIAGASDGGGTVKLLDFGIAKIVGDRTTKKAAEIVGTPAYMAPEQIESGLSDPRSDIWGLGAVLYEMLSGAPPFGAGEPDEVCKRVLEGAPEPLTRASVPERLRHVVHRCLNKNPALRYATAVELAYALEDYAPIESSVERVVRAAKRSGSQPPVPQRMVPTIIVPRKTGGGRLLAFLVVLASALIAGTATWFVLQHRAHSPATAHVTAAATAPPTGAPIASASASASPIASASASPIASASATPTASASASPIASASSDVVAAKPPHVARPRPVPKPHVTADAPPAEGDRFGTRK